MNNASKFKDTNIFIDKIAALKLWNTGKRYGTR